MCSTPLSPPMNIWKYDLRPRPHNFLLPLRDNTNYIPRTLLRLLRPSACFHVPPSQCKNPTKLKENRIYSTTISRATSKRQINETKDGLIEQTNVRYLAVTVWVMKQQSKKIANRRD